MTSGGGVVQGTCYGYRIESDHQLRFLRAGDGEPLVVVRGSPPVSTVGDLLKSWDPPNFPASVRLFRDGDGFRLWNEDAGWFAIDPAAGRIVVPPNGDPVRREERVWGLPTMLCFLARGDLAVHASCIEIDGLAVMLAAPRRFGKTTLAAAFASEGYRVLAEDLVCVRPGPSPSVVPGPAMLRVRRDVAASLTVPEAAEVARDDDRVHLSLPQRGTCDPVRLGGIVMLLEGDSDPRMERAAPAEVVPDLWFLSFKLPNDEDRERCFRAATQLAFTVPTWNLTRRLRIEDLPATTRSIVRAVLDLG